jgi:hypothetical protein
MHTGCFGKISYLALRKLYKRVFHTHTKSGTLFCKVVCHTNMCICPQYGQIIINYYTYMDMTLVIWIENHEYLFMIAHCGNTFFLKFSYFKIYIFLATSTYKSTPCGRTIIFSMPHQHECAVHQSETWLPLIK